MHIFRIVVVFQKRLNAVICGLSGINCCLLIVSNSCSVTAASCLMFRMMTSIENLIIIWAYLPSSVGSTHIPHQQPRLF